MSSSGERRSKSLEELRGRFRRIGRVPDPLGYVFSGLFVSSIGISLLLFELGLLDWRGALSLALVLTGTVLISDSIARYRRPWSRHRSGPYAFLGACLASMGILVGLGLKGWWCAPIVIAGVSLILLGFAKLREPKPAKQ